MVCIALAIIANRLDNDDNNGSDSNQLEESDYPVNSLAQAAEVLNTQTINLWTEHAGNGFTVPLPERLQSLNETEMQAMFGSAVPDDMLMFALDEDGTTNGVNVMIGNDTVNSTMTPETYATGVAEGFRANGYAIEDITAYPLGGRQTGRLIYSWNAPNAGPLTGVQFIFVENGTVWIVTGTGISADFENWLPIFQVIVREMELTG